MMEEGPGSTTSCSTASSRFTIKQHMELPETYKCAVTEIVVGEGGFHKVFRYDMRLLVRYTAFATLFTKGTVFTMDNNALRATGIMLLLVGFTAAVSLLVCINNMKALKSLD